MEVTPQNGIVDPGEVVESKVHITGLHHGSLNCSLACKIKNVGKPLTLWVRATVEGPSATIGKSKKWLLLLFQVIQRRQLVT